MMEDGARYLCGQLCRERFLAGERAFDPPRDQGAARSADRTSLPDRVRVATTSRAPAPPVDKASDELAVHPWAAAVLAALAVLVSTLSGDSNAWLAGVFVAGAALIVAYARARRGTRVEWVAPAALALGAAAALLPGERPTGWAMAGLGGVALWLSFRTAWYAWLERPVRGLASDLEALLPPTARVPANDEGYEEVPAEALRAGDLVVVLEGETIPADGVVQGSSGIAVRYPGSALSTPAEHGDFVLAGTRVLDGAIRVEARRTGRDRALDKAIRVGRNGNDRSSSDALLRRAIVRWAWAPVALVAFGLFFLDGLDGMVAWAVGVPLLGMLAALSAPAEAAALAAARRGMYFGSASALQKASRVQTTAILLRGALTMGEPTVRQVHRFGSLSVAKLLAVAAATERPARDHPIARAIIRRAELEAPRAPTEVQRSAVHPGLGVTATTRRGESVVVGRRQLLLDEGISVASADAEASLIENEGLTPIFVAVEDRLEGLLAISDPTQPGARDAVRRIAELPSDVVIVSGDDRRTVERVAAQLGASSVKAPLLPHERAREVRSLREQGTIVATVGRGGEDDEVLAAADVPISLRLVGSMLEDRGIAMTTHDARDAAGALWIARAAARTRRRCLGICAAVVGILALGSAAGWMTPFGAATLGFAAEAWTARAGSRLLRRVDLRVPTRQ